MPSGSLQIPVLLEAHKTHSRKRVLKHKASSQTRDTSNDATASDELSAHTYESLSRSNQALGNRYVIRDLIRPGTVTIASGRSGYGKSPLFYQAAVCVAAGVPFLDLPTTPGLAIMFDYENGSRQIQGMCDALQQYLGLTKVPSNLQFWTPDRSGDPLDMIRQVKPVLAIIDSLSAWRPACEEKNSAATAAMKELRQVAKESGCAIVVIHHLRKPPSDPRQKPESLEICDVKEWLFQVRGASALINAADARFGIDSPCEHGGDVVVAGFARIDGPLPKMCLRRVFNQQGAPLGYERLTGLALLDPRDASFLNQLNDQFSFKNAKFAHGRGDQSTKNLLNRLKSAGVIRQKVSRGPYQKVQEKLEHEHKSVIASEIELQNDSE